MYILRNDKSITGILFADDLDSRKKIQKLIVVHNYCIGWRLKANVPVQSRSLLKSGSLTISLACHLLKKKEKFLELKRDI